MNSTSHDRINVSDLQMLSTGGTSYVYLLDEEHIIKVFKPQVTLDEIKQEQYVSRFLAKQGVDTVECGDILQTDIGYGLVYERTKALNLSKTILNDPENMRYYAEKYVEIVKSIGKCTANENQLESVKDQDVKRIEKLKPYLTHKNYETLMSLAEAIPDCENIVHGDLHTRNVRYENGRMFVIDLCDAKRGPAIIDLACIYRYASVCAAIPFIDLCKRFTGLDKKKSKKLWNCFFEYYCRTSSVSDRKELLHKISLISTFCSICGVAMMDEHFIKTTAPLINLFVAFVIAPKYAEYLKVFSDMNSDMK